MVAANPDMLVEALDLGSGSLRAVIKDSIDIAGYRTGMGSRVFDDAVLAKRHAEVVDGLISSGIKIIGKATMHEFAYGVTGINPAMGTPVNPAYPKCIPGGSSSGSATAVASRVADIGIGTDTGGSIRMPAACCGVVGLKPSYGRVSRKGVHPRNSSLDCVGPFARDVKTIITAMAAIDPFFRETAPQEHFTIGVVAGDWLPEFGQIVDAIGSANGLSVKPIAVAGLIAAHQAGLTIMASENWSAFADLVQHPELGEDIRIRLSNARAIKSADVKAAEKVRSSFRLAVDQALEGSDALILPSLPSTAPTLAEAGDPAAIVNHTSLLRPFNLSGHPAISLPAEANNGLPFGVQIVGQMMQDELLCAVALRVEHVLEQSIKERIA